ncbi:hypothetical protein THERMOS_770 [Bathymodiolus thermophilus thioautotrophic gill symbiont]|uniref:Uncharacterized protein n=1 Tax=Bathymodiolus thermophilus thioautotrophic gill symbiont TaxID=2360 RepID=A0A8H8XB72_9GAMM|nr:hypothetical protein THERMOS_770 [Bathymodiolus thermophilus thioautotrophic gill symbiont]
MLIIHICAKVSLTLVESYIMPLLVKNYKKGIAQTYLLFFK